MNISYIFIFSNENGNGIVPSQVTPKPGCIRVRVWHRTSNPTLKKDQPSYMNANNRPLLQKSKNPQHKDIEHSAVKGLRIMRPQGLPPFYQLGPCEDHIMKQETLHNLLQIGVLEYTLEYNCQVPGERHQHSHWCKECQNWAH